MPGAVPAEVELFIEIQAAAQLWGAELATGRHGTCSPSSSTHWRPSHSTPTLSSPWPTWPNGSNARFSRKPVAPDARDLRYRILRAVRVGLGDHKNADKIDGLIETTTAAASDLPLRRKFYEQEMNTR